MDLLLFCGCPGMNEATVAHWLAENLGSGLQQTVRRFPQKSKQAGGVTDKLSGSLFCFSLSISHHSLPRDTAGMKSRWV